MFVKLCMLILIIMLYAQLGLSISLASVGKSKHRIRRDQLLKEYRFQPIAMKYHKTSYPKNEDRADYEINSYDTEYGGVVSNFTSTIYDDNPPLYPNPEILSKHNNPVNIRSSPSEATSNMDLPDDALADGDLKEHNIIDSVTYVYGNTNCYGKKEDWSWLIFLAGALSVAFMIYTVSYLLSQKKASEFRNLSKLYPICINLCCCLSACTVIYLQAIVGVSSSTRCEKIALLLHYAYCVCAVWIVLLSASVTEYLLYNAVLPLKYNYLLAYGVPAVFVMFNYALSMEHYEIKHYCWMSLEKGMVFGFMAPITTLILINTVIVIIGLQSIFEKQAEMLKAKIYDLVENFSRSEQKEDQHKAENLSDICSPSSSRKNTESSENFERDYELSEDDVHYVYLEPRPQSSQENNQPRPSPEKSGVQEYKGVLWIDVELESMAVKNRSEISALRSYLTLALVLEPFYAINWVMGVLVIENSEYWSTPLLYFVLIVSMFVYISLTLMTHLPIVPVVPPEAGAETAPEATLTLSRTTDSIPLLEPSVQQPTVSPPPGDSISTISI